MTSPGSEQDTPGGNEIDIGRVEGGRVSFPEWGAPSDKPTRAPKNPNPPGKRVGFAVLALGRLLREENLAAFGQTKRARLTALISGTSDKLAAVGEQCGVGPQHRYGYGDVERLPADASVEAVYVVSPNACHEAHVRIAVEAGKHVLCEKPMTTGAPSAERMIATCREAGRILMIAYRSQYETHMREAIRIARSGEIGRVKLIDALNIETLGDTAQWRLRAELGGGGSLPDVGLFCLNIARAITGEEPVEVYGAISTPERDPASPRWRTRSASSCASPPAQSPTAPRATTGTSRRA